MNHQPPARRLLIIFNPAAGLRRRRRLEAVLRHLRTRPCTIEILETTGPGDAERFAAAADPARYDVLVVAGGDGTVNEAINGLADVPLPLAILPLGTANVLAAEIGQALDPAAVATTIAQGRPQPITLGAANGRRFILMAGAGFDAHVVATVSVPLKRWLGKGAYALAMLLQLWRYGFPRYQVSIEGAPHTAGSVLIANARFYAGRFIAAPAADLRSPCFQVCLFERTGRLAALGYALALFTNRLPRLETYRIHPAGQIHIRGHPGEPLQADGDIIATLDARIEVLPGAIELIYPPGHEHAQARSTMTPGISHLAAGEVLDSAANEAPS